MERSIKKIFVLALTFVCGAVFAQPKKYSEKKAIILQDKCILWQLGDDGKMVDTKKTLEVGSDVSVKAAEDFSVENISAEWGKNSWSMQKGNFIKITHLDDEYYIFDGRIAVDMDSAVITVPSAAVYRSRNLASVTGKFLTSGMVLAVGKSYDITGGISLTSVAYLDSANQIVKGYVRSDKISSNRDDITAIAMLKEADDTYNLTKRRQIITAAKDLNVSGNVLEMIGEAEMRIRRSLDLSSAGAIEIASQVFYYDKKGDFIYIRDMPSTSGEVLGNLEYEEDFSVIRRTARSQTLYGTTDYWYYGVSAGGLDGWIYGGLLTPRPVEEDEESLENVGAPAENSSESSSENSSNTESTSTSE